MCARRRWFQRLLGFDSYRNAGPRRIVALPGPRPARLALESLEDRTLLAASALQFASTYFSGAEGMGPAQVTVTRTGDTTGTATVKYATGNGTATAGTDYTTASGTLAFAAGDASKTFTVPILDSTVLDGDKTVKLTLTTPTGAGLGGPSVAVLTVADKQGTTHTQQYVFQLYKDLLNRLPDDAGVFHFGTEIDQGLVSRTQAALEIINSPEYRNDVVANIYQQYLHRAPQAAEAGFWVNSLAQGGTIEQVRANVLGSPEYYTKRGAGTNDGFLKALYPDVLGRPLDAAGQAFFGQQFQQGTTPVAAAVLATPEYLQDVVQGYFQQLLHHAADAGALGYYVPQLQQGQRDEQVLAAVVSSEEYFGFDQAFISQVYLDLLNRTPDTAGMNYWAGFLGGASRTQLVQSIQSSQEYQTDVVQQQYENLLGRDATAQELPFWQNYLTQGGTAAGMEVQIIGSGEYFNYVGGNNDRFVQAVYEDGLQRELDLSGAASWGQMLTSGTDRATVAADILGSTEGNTDLIQNYIDQYLQRTPDGDGTNYFVSLLQGGAPAETAVAQMLGSPEYYQNTGHLQAQMFNNPKDPVQLRTQAADGAVIEFLGTKDVNGVPTGLTSAIILTPDGQATVITVDAQGRPVQFQSSDGSTLSVSWLSASQAQVTTTAANGSVTVSAPFDALAPQSAPAPPRVPGAVPPATTNSGLPALSAPVGAPPNQNSGLSGTPSPGSSVFALVKNQVGQVTVEPLANRAWMQREPTRKTPSNNEMDPCELLSKEVKNVCESFKLFSKSLKDMQTTLEKEAKAQAGDMGVQGIQKELEPKVAELGRIDAYCNYLSAKAPHAQKGPLSGLAAFICMTAEGIVDAYKEAAKEIIIEAYKAGSPPSKTAYVPWQGGQPFPDFGFDQSRKVVYLPPLIQLDREKVDVTLAPDAKGSDYVLIKNAAPLNDSVDDPMVYSVSITANDTSGSNWLTLPTGFTNRSLAVGSTDQLTFSFDATGLSGQTCHATVTIQDAAQLRNPQTVAVTLTVTGTPPPPPTGTADVTITSATAIRLGPNSVQVVANGTVTGDVGDFFEPTVYSGPNDALTSQWTVSQMSQFPIATRGASQAATATWSFKSKPFTASYSGTTPNITAFVAAVADPKGVFIKRVSFAFP